MEKILYVVSTLGRTGPTKQLHGLLSKINREIYAPQLLTLSPEPEDSLWGAFVELGIPMESLNYQRLQGLFCNRKGVAGVIARIKPHLIHTHGFRVDCVFSRLNLLCPRVTVVRNDPWCDFPKKFGYIQGAWMAWRHIRAICHATVTICCSETIATLFREQYKAQNIQTIQNGVDIEKYFRVDQKNREILRQKLAFSEGEEVFLSVSSLVKRKDLETLVRGFQIANIERSKLVILGDGPERSSLEELSKSNSNIQFCGNVANVNEYLSAADFFVSSSLSEGLPNSVLEAMASGLPVILSDIPSHRELLASNTFAESLLFPTKNAATLAKSLRSAMEADHREMSNQLLSIIQKKFSVTNMAEKYQKIYSQCLQACGEKHV